MVIAVLFRLVNFNLLAKNLGGNAALVPLARLEGQLLKRADLPRPRTSFRVKDGWLAFVLLQLDPAKAVDISDETIESLAMEMKAALQSETMATIVYHSWPFKPIHEILSVLQTVDLEHRIYRDETISREPEGRVFAARKIAEWQRELSQ